MDRPNRREASGRVAGFSGRVAATMAVRSRSGSGLDTFVQQRPCSNRHVAIVAMLAAAPTPGSTHLARIIGLPEGSTSCLHLADSILAALSGALCCPLGSNPQNGSSGEQVFFVAPPSLCIGASLASRQGVRKRGRPSFSIHLLSASAPGLPHAAYPPCTATPGYPFTVCRSKGSAVSSSSVSSQTLPSMPRARLHTRPEGHACERRRGHRQAHPVKRSAANRGAAPELEAFGADRVQAWSGADRWKLPDHNREP